jgi:hypothetical protein
MNEEIVGNRLAHRFAILEMSQIAFTEMCQLLHRSLIISPITRARPFSLAAGG